MANLSDLAASLDPGASPAWFERIGPSAGFVEGLPSRVREPYAPSAQPAAEAAQEAIDAAYRAGEEAGRAAVEMEITARLHDTDKLRLRMVQLDEVAMQAFKHKLIQTVATLCEGALESEALDRQTLTERCDKAAALLGDAPGLCALHLNPEDIPQLDEDFAAKWRIIANPEMERGALRLEGPDGSISDGPDEWRRAIAAALQP